jgi:heme-degrading monooxygenase HmoA
MNTPKSEHIYRVDKFVVPDGAREEFIGRVQQTHQVLRTIPGFLQDFVLEQSSGPGTFNFVTIVEWASQASIQSARAAVTELHAGMNFDPQEMFARLGIKADVANYKQVGA